MKLWVASVPTPLWAVKAIGEVPVAVEVPESRPVVDFSVSPSGLPVSL